VPGGKGSVIVDNTTGELKGIGGLGFWWEEEVDTTRFVKTVPRRHQAGGGTVQDRHPGLRTRLPRNAGQSRLG
jgi:hypothetical protein